MLGLPTAALTVLPEDGKGISHKGFIFIYCYVIIIVIYEPL